MLAAFHEPSEIDRHMLTVISRLVVLMALLSGLLSCGASEPLVATSFRQSPGADGWRPMEAAGSAGRVIWAPPAGRTDDGAVTIQRGHLLSPAFAQEPFQYYRLAFRARSSDRFYWFGRLYDAEGEQLAADHVSAADPSADWRSHEYAFRGRLNAQTGRISFAPQTQPVELDEVLIEPVEQSWVREWSEAVYATVPPLQYVPPENRHSHLPQLVEKLESGGTLRIVMLGDSIANDTANSAFDVLLEHAHPGATIELINSVKGGTGCTWYQHENRVQDYVIRYDPDLLILAGISHGNDPEAMRSVIRQVREEIDPEIIVSTGAVTTLDTRIERTLQQIRESPEKAEAAERRARSFAERLERMAAEENVAFLDMQAAWDAYMAGHARDARYFQRDYIHANHRGRAVLARMMLRFLCPGD